jgi:hypothetical protein
MRDEERSSAMLETPADGPGGGDHPAGGGQAGDRAVPGVAPARLFADPGHQEDVAVDAERDQEHEDVQREKRVGAASR